VNRSLQEKQAEKQRLLKAHKENERQKWADLCEREPRMKSFRKAVRRTTNPQALIFGVAQSWVRFAPEDVQRAASQIVHEHTESMRERMGLERLCDPLPPQRSAWRIVRGFFPYR